MIIKDVYEFTETKLLLIEDEESKEYNVLIWCLDILWKNMSNEERDVLRKRDKSRKFVEVND